MLSKSEFLALLAGAYEQLYDLARLRSHPLGPVLAPEPALSRKERAWELQRVLLQAIDELDPGPKAQPLSPEWRRYRLMVLRYVRGLDPKAIAEQLVISRRHFYREHDAAVEMIADILWQRHVAQQPAPAEPFAGPEEQAPRDRLELLRLEAARMSRGSPLARIAEVLQGVLSLLEERLAQRRVEVRLALAESALQVTVERNVLRQMLVGVLGHLIERVERGAILIAVQQKDEWVEVTLSLEPAAAVVPASETAGQVRLPVAELVALSGAQLWPIWDGGSLAGFRLQLPARWQRTVLVVDDNEDVLQLFQRYLGLHHYRVVTAQRAVDALRLASELQLCAITLDLMMPEQDGWDLLKALLSRPDTRDTPIIVCSVLAERDLALSLGATAFLAKPITEEALISVLDALQAGS